MISSDIQDASRRIERHLKRVATKAIPHANRAAINAIAFDVRREGMDAIRDNMTLRNKWTERSIRVKKATTREPFAEVGSVLDYMETQEFGGVKRARGSEGVPIATSYSAGQAAQRPRTRLPRGQNKLSRISLRGRKARSANRAQANAIAVKQAAESQNKFVFMELGRRKGIFRVLGKGRNIRVRMVHDLTKRIVRIPRNPWLEPASKRAQRYAPQRYLEALRWQMDRLSRQ